MKFFIYDKENEQIVLNDEGILHVREIKALLDNKRNITKTDKTGKNKSLAYKEFTFLYLFFDWESPYFQFTEADRYSEAFKDCKLTELEMEDSVFKEACKKYDEIQNASRIGKLLKASYLTIDKITHYLETLDLAERDPVTGKPVFKTKDVIAEIGSASKLIDAIKTLEVSFKKEIEPENALRGDVTQGMFD